MDVAAIVVLKFLHFIGLMMGAGAGIGQMVVAARIRRDAEGATAPLQAIRPIFGKVGLYGIVLLWVTGLALWFIRYGFVNLGVAYALKLVVATVLLGMILGMSQAMAKAIEAGRPPPAWLPKLGMATAPLTLLAVFLAALVFY